MLFFGGSYRDIQLIIVVLFVICQSIASYKSVLVHRRHRMSLNDVISGSRIVTAPVAGNKARVQVILPVSNNETIQIQSISWDHTLELTNDIMNSPKSLDDELVDWIDERGEAVLALPRSLIHKYNLYHRGIGVLLIDSSCRIFVHQRSNQKRIFPGLWDMFVGGVSPTGESSSSTLARELFEEANVDISSLPIIPLPPSISNLDDLVRSVSARGVIELGQVSVATELNHCLVDCYVLVCDRTMADTIRFNDGEIQAGAWEDLADVRAAAADGSRVFVPDGLLVWRALSLLQQ